MRSNRIVPEPPVLLPEDAESISVWGFSDTAFEMLDGDVVRLSGDRYELAGQELPDLLAWVRDQIHPDIAADNLNPSRYPPPLPEARVNDAFVEDVRGFLGDDQLSDDAEVRLRRGHGQTQEEMYRIKYDRVGRIPDLVVFPASDEEVERIVRSANAHDVSLIPYGGGTNVSNALYCPEFEARMIVVVDMSRMNRILWIDPDNHMACIQAGAVGRTIAEQLAEHGFTLGHEPDSIEFSTMGGWVATHASGMKKNRYGNIEDLLLDVTVVTSTGTLSRPMVAPRESVGVGDVRRWILGSEGGFGIITQAIVKIYPLPEVQEYGSIIFPNLDKGVDFLYELTRTATPPASVRLVDNTQFQLSQTLKPHSAGLKKLKSSLEKWFVLKVKGFDPNEMTACTLVFEGSKAEVRTQQRDVYRIAAKHQGMNGGASNGKRGYQLTYGIAYLRDWILNHWLLAESFETSAAWTDALAVCNNVKKRLAEEHKKRNLPGKPFMSCRVTQVYPTGVCIYFYFAFYFKGVDNPSEVFSEIEHAARDEVLKSGGSLSHHHGIGKIRQDFLPRVLSQGVLDWQQQIKKAVDPGNVFGAGNQAFETAEGDDG
ncbi:MAG: FAD-binding oxidoreductase [Gammaproteobacteria bacterium]|nr:FAD-binding oxidoreductase [Gammaproteobacteria bacterium]NNF50185.1 FAD-binding oxidoreductase [Woeseiaceae bacterium]MBT8094488.1 FAD-binding oxidoreductase [Gammaproteobacteria bacterium]MBT8104480.1 FAD-binding oxidoreductase [Gammaproteobacteria bacterium]NNK24494.1 FAD-binding oxidoreductase [Woeseiaceae bacterium]